MTGYLLVRSGGAPYGLPLDGIAEVVDDVSLVRMPVTRPAVRGVTPLREGTLPVVHLHALVRGGTPDAAFSGTVVVLRPGAGRLAIEVDDALEVIRGDVLPVPTGQRMPWALGVAAGQDELVPIVDPGALHARLRSDEREPA